jgi:hypothetical protein
MFFYNPPNLFRGRHQAFGHQQFGDQFTLFQKIHKENL